MLPCGPPRKGIFTPQRNGKSARSLPLKTVVPMALATDAGIAPAAPRPRAAVLPRPGRWLHGGPPGFFDRQAAALPRSGFFPPPPASQPERVRRLVPLPSASASGFSPPAVSPEPPVPSASSGGGPSPRPTPASRPRSRPTITNVQRQADPSGPQVLPSAEKCPPGMVDPRRRPGQSRALWGQRLVPWSGPASRRTPPRPRREEPSPTLKNQRPFSRPFCVSRVPPRLDLPGSFSVYEAIRQQSQRKAQPKS